jgi:hypothetical protein
MIILQISNRQKKIEKSNRDSSVDDVIALKPENQFIVIHNRYENYRLYNPL